jgi:hypothetical protein
LGTDADADADEGVDAARCGSDEYSRRRSMAGAVL